MKITIAKNVNREYYTMCIIHIDYKKGIVMKNVTRVDSIKTVTFKTPKEGFFVDVTEIKESRTSYEAWIYDETQDRKEVFCRFNGAEVTSINQVADFVESHMQDAINSYYNSDTPVINAPENTAE